MIRGARERGIERWDLRIEISAVDTMVMMPRLVVITLC
jgi:hypothetical protein